jgi:hypothetical protein
MRDRIRHAADPESGSFRKDLSLNENPFFCHAFFCHFGNGKDDRNMNDTKMRGVIFNVLPTRSFSPSERRCALSGGVAALAAPGSSAVFTLFAVR